MDIVSSSPFHVHLLIHQTSTFHWDRARFSPSTRWIWNSAMSIVQSKSSHASCRWHERSFHVKIIIIAECSIWWAIKRSIWSASRCMSFTMEATRRVWWRVLSAVSVAFIQILLFSLRFVSYSHPSLFIYIVHYFFFVSSTTLEMACRTLTKQKTKVVVAYEFLILVFNCPPNSSSAYQMNSSTKKTREVDEFPSICALAFSKLFHFHELTCSWSVS